MPLRDILRGMSAFATLTSEAIKPSADKPPLPIPSPLLAAMDAVSAAGARVADIEVDVADIAAASAALKRSEITTADAIRFCRVFVQSWSKLLSLNASEHFIVSEVIVSGGFERTRMKAAKTASERAANLISSLRKMHAAGRLPGTPFAGTAEEQAEIDLALFATVLWLFADREQAIADENRLLELALILTKAQKDTIMASLASKAELAACLQDLAEQL